jgi:hypothetical protein
MDYAQVIIVAIVCKYFCKDMHDKVLALKD